MRTALQPISRQLINRDSHDAAQRISSYVYGNILIMAALVAMNPHDLETGHLMLVIVATGLTTFFAHVISERMELQTLQGDVPLTEVLDAMRNASPIVTSTVFPVAVLSVAWVFDWSLHIAWWLAIAAVMGRMVFLGSVIARHRGEKVRPRHIIEGIALAAVSLLAAYIKAKLTH